MSRVTPATRSLDAARISYRLQSYDYDPDASNIGQHAATATGIDPVRMFKTLMLELDGHPVCAVVPVTHDLSLKRLAATLGGKHAGLLPAATAERITGYHVGGISPFGQKKRVPVALDASALNHATIWCNGGQRGLMMEVDPQAIVQLLDTRCGAISNAP
ncbi:Cys-tRNA(Pro) deacylase [Xanthomonadaceae bacterium JHOS43]|nr:Cys-tRNA(Pro) deacylase [Xanthomonadaceae bacterium JHOS43]